MKRTAGLITVIATVVLGAAAVTVFAFPGASSPDLGPNVVVPSSPSDTTPTTPDSGPGATPVSPPAPPAAGNADDD